MKDVWLAYKIEDRKISLKLEGVALTDAIKDDFKALAEKHIQ